jgi:drug/metabolite transporter (DMT)-like permease
VVSIIIATIPLFVALMAVFIFKEKLSKLNFFGIILSISGIVVMLGHNFLDAQYSFYIFLSFGAVLSTIGYNFFLRKIPTTYSPLVVITWQNIFGLLAFLPLVFIIENNNIETIVSQYNAFNDVLNLSFLLILSIFCSVIAFIFYISSLRVLGVARTNIFANLIPVMTLIIAFYVLNEAITINKVLGMIIVISGIFLVQFKRKQENHSKK